MDNDGNNVINPIIAALIAGGITYLLTSQTGQTAAQELAKKDDAKEA